MDQGPKNMKSSEKYHPHSVHNKGDFSSMTSQFAWKKMGAGYTMFLPLYYGFCHYRHQDEIGTTKLLLSGIRVLVRGVLFGIGEPAQLQAEGAQPEVLITPPYRMDAETLLSSDYYGAFITAELKNSFFFIKPANKRARVSWRGGVLLVRMWLQWFKEVERLLNNGCSSELNVCRRGVVDSFQQVVRAFAIVQSGRSKLSNPLRTLDCASIYSFPWKIALSALGFDFKQIEYVNGLIYPEHYHYWFEYNPDPRLIPDVLLVDNPNWVNQLRESRYEIKNYDNYLRCNDLYSQTAPLLFASTGINEERLLREIDLLRGYRFSVPIVFKPHPGYGYSEGAIETIRAAGFEVEMESLYTTKRKYSALVSINSSLLYEHQFHKLPVYRIPSEAVAGKAANNLLELIPILDQGNWMIHK